MPFFSISFCFQETLVLQKLIVSYNDIGPDGGVAIAKGVQVGD